MGTASARQSLDFGASRFPEYEGYSERPHQTPRSLSPVCAVGFAGAPERAFRAGSPVAVYAARLQNSSRMARAAFRHHTLTIPDACRRSRVKKTRCITI